MCTARGVDGLKMTLFRCLLLWSLLSVVFVVADPLLRKRSSESNVTYLNISETQAFLASQVQRIQELETLVSQLRLNLTQCTRRQAHHEITSRNGPTRSFDRQRSPVESNSKVGAEAKAKFDASQFATRARHHRNASNASVFLDRSFVSHNWVNLTKSRSAMRRLDEARPVVGICLASTSKSKKKTGHGLSAIPFFSVFLPSLAKTVEQGVDYRIYCGVDKGDTYYDSPKNQKEVQTWFDANIAKSSAAKGINVSLKVLLFDNPIHKPGPAFNYACKTAYDEGVDYMYRVNDDSEFTTVFATNLIAELESRCPPFLGVTGPTCREGNTGILTHDFTSRIHLKIFDTYYPSELTDWWLDDWVTHVYGSDRTSRVENVIVKHHLGAAGW